MSSDSDSSEGFLSASDEEEGGDGDLAHGGAAATTVKFQTVKQQTFQRVEKGDVSDGLVQHIIRSSQPSGAEICPTYRTEEVCDVTPGKKTTVFQKNFIKVQQQYGDVIVHGTRNLTIGGTQNIGHPHPSQGDQDIEALLNRTLCRIERLTKSMVTTSALESVMEKLHAGSKWVTIRGSPGEGKTTVGYMALAEMYKTNRQVFQVTSPTEFSKVMAACPNAVFLLDDIFGDLEFEVTEWLKWKPVLHEYLEVTNHRSLQQDRTSTKTATIILVGRDYILNAATCEMGRISEFFRLEDHMVSMLYTRERDIKEKYNILNAICESSGMDLDQTTKDTICCSSCPHGFPHVCRQFLNIRRNDPQTSAETFFKSPLEFLNQTIAKFMRDKKKMTLFKEMIKKKGKVNVEYLGHLENGIELLLIANDLDGTYLKKEGGCILFDHQSVYESVALQFYSVLPQFVLENCDFSIIYKIIKASDSKQIKTPSQGSSHVASMASSHSSCLTKFFADEISNRNFNKVLPKKEFTDETFVRDIMSQLSLPPNEIIRTKDCTTGAAFLSLIASNTSSQLLKNIDHQTNIRLTQKDVNMILYGVCMYAASDVLSYMMKKGHAININVQYQTIGYMGVSNQTPLMIASETGNSQLVDQILSLKPDVFATDTFGKTALHYLSENGLLQAVRKVVDRRAGLNVQDKWRHSPLYYACRNNHIEVAILLLEKGTNIDDEVLAKECGRGNLKILKMLITGMDKVQMIPGIDSFFTTVCMGGDKMVMQFLKDNGVSLNRVDALHRSPLHTACMRKNHPAVRGLLEHGAVVNIRDDDGYLPLHKAAEHRSKECIDKLLKAGSEKNAQGKNGSTALHVAAASGSKECVEILLKVGANVNLQNNDGDTALHRALKKRSKECVEMLLQAGADADVQNKDGLTPLHRAAEKGEKKCTELLLNAGANVNSKNKNGHTPLHIAGAKGYKECVDVLLLSGADVNAVDTSNQTPLHSAVYFRKQNYVNVPNIDVCKSLIRHSANVNQQDAEGNTPLHLLCEVDADTKTDRYHQPASSYTDVYKALVTLLIDNEAEPNIYNDEGMHALRGWCKVLLSRTNSSETQIANVGQTTGFAGVGIADVLFPTTAVATAAAAVKGLASLFSKPSK